MCQHTIEKALIFSKLDSRSYEKKQNSTIRKLAKNHAHQFDSIYCFVFDSEF
jgi:hypothetical protein